MKTVAIRLGIIGLIVVGGLTLRPFLGGNAGDLKVGECFEAPVGDETVKDVQHRPCTDPHTGEVVLVQDVPSADGATYPTDSAWLDIVGTTCVPAFNAYTGLDFDTDPTWDLGYFIPTTEGWGDGDRSLICYATLVDGTPTSTSVKVGG